MGNIGTTELIIGLLVVFVLFGAKRLPDAARGLGQSLKIFKTEMQQPAADDRTGPPAVVPSAPATEQTADRA